MVLTTSGAAPYTRFMADEPVTERTLAGSDLDELSTDELVERMNAEDASVSGAVRAALPSIAAVVDAIVARLEAGGRLLYVGAGSSGRLAEADAAECEGT